MALIVNRKKNDVNQATFLHLIPFPTCSMIAIPIATSCQLVPMLSASKPSSLSTSTKKSPPTTAIITLESATRSASVQPARGIIRNAERKVIANSIVLIIPYLGTAHFKYRLGRGRYRTNNEEIEAVQTISSSIETEEGLLIRRLRTRSINPRKSL